MYIQNYLYVLISFKILTTFIILLASVILFSDSPVYSIFSLVLVFALSSISLFFLNLEFIPLTYLMVYMGTIAVLFIFNFYYNLNYQIISSKFAIRSMFTSIVYSINTFDKKYGSKFAQYLFRALYMIGPEEFFYGDVATIKAAISQIILMVVDNWKLVAFVLLVWIGPWNIISWSLTSYFKIMMVLSRVATCIKAFASLNATIAVYLLLSMYVWWGGGGEPPPEWILEFLRAGTDGNGGFGGFGGIDGIDGIGPAPFDQAPPNDQQNPPEPVIIDLEYFVEVEEVELLPYQDCKEIKSTPSKPEDSINYWKIGGVIIIIIFCTIL